MTQSRLDVLLNAVKREQEDITPFTEQELTHEHTILYRSLIKAMPGFKTRSEQQRIVKACGEAILNQGIAAIQADTGVGKTLGYLLAALPFVTQKEKRLVVSTHTVALQTQLIDKDIPTIQEHLAKDLKVEIAKGAGRYYCPKRTHDLLSKTEKVQGGKGLSEQEKQEELFEADELQSNACDEQIILIKKLYDSFNDKSFNGDLDTCDIKGVNDVQEMVNRQADRCPKTKNCEFGETCPYFIQREAIEHADIVVANHSLTSIAAVNDHTVLGSLEDSIIVYDEAHHVHDVYRKNLKASFEPQAILDIRKKVDNLPKLLNRMKKMPRLASSAQNDTLNRALEDLMCILDDNEHYISELDSYLVRNYTALRGDIGEYDNGDQWVLSLNPTEKSFTQQLGVALQVIKCIQEQLTVVNRHSDDAKFLDVENLDIKETACATEWKRLLTVLNEYFDMGAQCLERFVEFDEYLTHDQRVNCGLVRWVEREEHKRDVSYRLVSNVVDVKAHFQEHVLERAEAAVFTSATLKIQEQFDHFINPLGLSDIDKPFITCDIQSPFDYQAACFSAPLYNGNPNHPRHAETVLEYVKQSVDRHKSILVLFTSYRQLNEVYSMCNRQLKSRILCQSDYSKRELIERHKTRIDEGETSILFGVDGLSEGMDLQQHYLTCVVIAKLPFPALGEPMFKHEKEMLEAKGQKAFFQQSLPICERKLIQSAGRLIRSEDDYGEVILLDPRVNTKQYGRNLLASLPIVQRGQRAV